MTLVLVRIVSLVLLPPGLLVALGLAALLLARRRPRAARIVAMAAVLLLWSLSTGGLARRLASPIEREFPPVRVTDSPSAQAIVVLGGALEPARPPRLGPELGRGSNRVLHAARLFRAGKAPLIVASGGVGPGSDTTVPEATDMAGLLAEWGVPPAAILPEGRSRNTRENAAETRRLLQPQGIRRILLVTSALHMPRAARLFRWAGFEVIPAPTDFRAVVPEGFSLLRWMPTADGLELSSEALRERLGLLYETLRGGLD